MKETVFYDGLYSGHHISYAKNILFNTENTKLLVNKNRVDIFSDVQTERLYILRCNDPNSYKNTNIGWVINFINILFDKRLFKSNLYFLYADPIVIYIFFFFFLTRRKLFITIHWANAILPIKLENKLLKKSYRKFKFFTFGLLLHRISSVFVHGDYTRKGIEEFYKTQKVCAIPYGIDMINREKVLCKNDKKNHSTENKILFFGGLRKDKGIERLSKIVSLLPDMEFIIAGNKGDFSNEYLYELFNRYPNAKLKLEHIPDEKVEGLFLNADVLILPYEYYFSGQSGPMTIATIYRVPIVASNVGDMGSEIRGYNLGIAVDNLEPENFIEAIREVISNNNKYKQSHDKYYERGKWSKVGKIINKIINSNNFRG
ncbi:glycosyltransferase family 4 protein [Bacillus sp. V3]|nr:glycosyltransferase family 4 protein [Bacillus sp. V3]